MPRLIKKYILELKKSACIAQSSAGGLFPQVLQAMLQFQVDSSC